MKHETMHEPFQELLSLRLYGELDPAEERRLEEHLATCAACRAFGDELAGSLGALARSVARADDLDLAWRTGLAAQVHGERSRRRLRTLATFAAGLAAGLLAMAALRSAPARTGRAPAAILAASPPFELRADPPPVATGRGQLARLGSLLAR
jgi:anti-sigma factor RsiW